MCLEITETALIEETAEARETLEAIAALGVHIALDDFGTGYSSLAHLRQFPVDVLKIDRSFVDRVETNDRERQIVGAVTAMAHVLKHDRRRRGDRDAWPARAADRTGLRQGAGLLACASDAARGARRVAARAGVGARSIVWCRLINRCPCSVRPPWRSRLAARPRAPGSMRGSTTNWRSMSSLLAVAPPALSRGLVRWVAVRTRFLDELVRGAVGDGSGRSSSSAPDSTRARFGSGLPRDLTVFEIDHAEVISFKQQLLDELELISECRRRVVVADLVTDDWLQRLTDTGWARSQPTVWVVEGLLVYLNHDDRTRLLTQLASASDRGSVLGATLSTRIDNLAHPLWHPAAVADPDAVVGRMWLAGDGADDGRGERGLRAADSAAVRREHQRQAGSRGSLTHALHHAAGRSDRRTRCGTFRLDRTGRASSLNSGIRTYRPRTRSGSISNTLPQCGLASNGASCSSIAVSTGATAAMSLIQVKWIAKLSRPYAGLSHNSSAAIVRSSQICSTGAIRCAMLLIAVTAAAADSRDTKYSVCNSSPLLGCEVEPKVRQPLVPRLRARRPARCMQLDRRPAPDAAGRRPRRRRSSRVPRRPATASIASVRCLTHTWFMTGRRQSVNTLTLYAAFIVASRCCVNCARDRSSYTYCATSKVGSIASVTAVAMPSIPKPITAPAKSLSPISRVTTSPLARDEFESADGGGEIPVARAGPVSAGRGCAGDADMRQRAEVVQCVAGPMQLRCELSIPDAAADRHGRPLGIDVQQRRHAGERDLVTGRVGDGVERVPAAQGANSVAAGDDSSHFIDGRRVVQLGGTKDDIPGPIRGSISHRGPLGVAVVVAGQE